MSVPEHSWRVSAQELPEMFMCQSYGNNVKYITHLQSDTLSNGGIELVINIAMGIRNLALEARAKK